EWLRRRRRSVIKHLQYGRRVMDAFITREKPGERPDTDKENKETTLATRPNMIKHFANKFFKLRFVGALPIRTEVNLKALIRKTGSWRIVDCNRNNAIVVEFQGFDYFFR